MVALKREAGPAGDLGFGAIRIAVLLFMATSLFNLTKKDTLASVRCQVAAVAGNGCGDGPVAVESCGRGMRPWTFGKSCETF